MLERLQLGIGMLTGAGEVEQLAYVVLDAHWWSEAVGPARHEGGVAKILDGPVVYWRDFLASLDAEFERFLLKMKSVCKSEVSGVFVEVIMLPNASHDSILHALHAVLAMNKSVTVAMSWKRPKLSIVMQFHAGSMVKGWSEAMNARPEYWVIRRVSEPREWPVGLIIASLMHQIL